VWVLMFVRRVGEMRARRIPPQDIATSQQAASLLRNVQAADNFRNLFELPVLFYVLCIALYVTRSASHAFVLGAWVFVCARVLHSLIHCTYNRVMHRFAAYLIGGLVLFAMWIAFAIELAGRPHVSG